MRGDVLQGLEPRLDRWRERVAAGAADADPARIEQLERALRDQTAELMAAGLDVDEAFLIGLKRISDQDPVTSEFAREFAAGLWAAEQTGAPRAEAASGLAARTEFLFMLACAVGAAVAIKIPALLGYGFDEASDFYTLNLTFFALPFLAAFLAWVKRPPRRQLIAVAGVFIAGIVAVNVYPFVSGGSTQMLAALHLPIVLWLAVGVIVAGAGWRTVRLRMAYTKFTGEWFITYTLIALGGGVLSAITMGVFEAIGIDAEAFVSEWLIPCGAMGAVVVAAWLVETRRNLVGGLAPMLAKVFTPLFATMLVTLLVGVVWSRGLIALEREVLILFDVLLAVVLALVLYAIAARDPHAGPGLFDRVQLVLVSAALLVDVYALAGIVARLSEWGFSANKAAALGLNAILLVNLAWSAYLLVGFLRSRRDFEALEMWQMRYLPVYALWAAIVVVVFPPLFGFA